MKSLKIVFLLVATFWLVPKSTGFRLDTAKFPPGISEIEKIVEASKHVEIEPSATSFRLPNNTVPLHYDIHIQTEIHTGNPVFEGAVKIRIRVLEQSNTITMHYRETIIRSINIISSNGSTIETGASFAQFNDVEHLVITPKNSLQVDQEMIIEIKYAGILSRGISGFYRFEYFNLEKGDTVTIAATNFLPSKARHAFPCYDEIQFRTPIDLQISHSPDFIALSNMPVSSVLDSQGGVTSTFHQTPSMPIHQLSFTVTDFYYKNNNELDILLAIYAPKPAIDAGLVDPALAFSHKMLESMKEILDFPYPLVQSKIIAGPYVIGVHSWGLSTIFDYYLIESPNESLAAKSNRQLEITRVLTHNYFSNLVSPAGWDSYWLSSGLAELYSFIFNDMINPENQFWELFKIQDRDLSLILDTFNIIRPLNHPAETPNEIESKLYNFVTAKSAIVLKMFKDALGDEVFLDGIRIYLDEMQFSTVRAEDLYRSLQKAYDRAFPDNSLNIGELMQPWIDLPRFPVIEVSRKGSSLLLAQNIFGDNQNELFSVPIAFATESNPNFDDATAKHWLTSQQSEIPVENDNEWLIMNIRETGYYVTNYEQDLWLLNAKGLKKDHDKIHRFSRGNLFADFSLLMNNGYDLNSTIFLELVQSLAFEDSSDVWTRTENSFNLYNRNLRGTEIYDKYNRMIRDVLTPAYQRTIDNFRGRDVLNQYACMSGVESCLSESLEALTEVMRTGRTTFEFEYRCNGLMTANEIVWMHFYNEALRMNPDTTDRYFALHNLPCTRNKTLLEYFLDQLFNPRNNFSNFERTSMILRVINLSYEGYEAVIEFIETYHERVNESLDVGNIVFNLAISTNSDEDAQRVLSLVQFARPESIITEESIRNDIEISLKFVRRNLDELKLWLDNYEPVIV